ncbi:MAG: aldo/keto reductase [bacterium]
MYQTCPPDTARQTLQTAWDAGIRYFDTAPFYGTGLTEQRLGSFLAGKPHADYVLSTKAGRLLTPPIPYGSSDHRRRPQLWHPRHRRHSRRQVQLPNRLP